eukprot:m.32523 g.32523  ORF g.32523 m.32523 type:complete len:137 (+) comp12157_c1_seq1:388-798(+)
MKLFVALLLASSCAAVLVREQTFTSSSCVGTPRADTTNAAGIHGNYGPCISPAGFSNSWQLSLSGKSCSNGDVLLERVFSSTDCSGVPGPTGSVFIGECSLRANGGSIEFTCSAFQQASATMAVLLASLFCIYSLL